MTIVVPSLLDESSSFLQVTSTNMNAWVSLNFDKIQFLTTALAALERLKNQRKML